MTDYHAPDRKAREKYGKGKPLTAVFENEPNWERLVRAYARLVEQQEGVKLKSVTWRLNSTGEVHTTDLVKDGCAG